MHHMRPPLSAPFAGTESIRPDRESSKGAQSRHFSASRFHQDAGYVPSTAPPPKHQKVDQRAVPCPPVKIIVAEDSEVQRLYLCSLINGLGFEAIEAEDGKVALDLLGTTGAPIVITDLRMPNLDGMDLTRAIRRLDLDTYVHVIMMTEADQSDTRAEALDAGVDDFIGKGDGSQILRARLRTATRLIEHAAELAERTRIVKDANARIEQDLHAAAAAQRQLLPNLQDEIGGFRVASVFVPSAIVSGDMFGCFALDDDMLAFYAVDVSGHGVHASLLSVAIGHLVTPDYVRAHAFDDRGGPAPALMVAALNARFSASENDDYFTMFCGLIDLKTGQMTYCQAGYPTAYYVDPAGQTTAVGDGGFPVGMFPTAQYETNTHPFAPGASLMICSDAAAEAENPSRESFGITRVRDIARTIPAVGADKVPDQLVQALATWRGGAALEDDLTIVTLNRKVLP